MTTWNVLHRIHAMNWDEAPVAAFPDERVRNAAIAETVARWLVEGTDVVCLQEVSGDQLARLRDAVAAEVRIFEHRYPRVPRLRLGGSTKVLDDPSEHLVVLVRSLPAHLREAYTFASDPGKGFLAVDVGDDLVVVDTHVSWGPRAGAQLATLKAAALAARPAAVVTGDFNAPFDDVAAALGPHFLGTEALEPTRLPSSGEGGSTIDHVLARGASLARSSVLDGGGLSDHRPVTAELVAHRR